jgi:hypothetical protein
MADGIHDRVPERNLPYRQPVSAKQNELGGRKTWIPKAKSTLLTVFSLTVKWPAEEPFLPQRMLAMLTDITLKKIETKG